MGNASTSSDEECQRISLLESLKEQDTSPEWSSVVAKAFCKAMDGDRSMLLEALSDRAELVWFGRQIFHGSRIVEFLNLVAPYSKHNFITAVETKVEYSSSESEESMEIYEDYDEPTLENIMTPPTAQSELSTNSENSSITSEDEENCKESEPLNIENSSIDSKDEENHEPLNIENCRKRHAVDTTYFDELRAERNSLKNQENIEICSSIKRNNDNLISKYGRSMLEISRPTSVDRSWVEQDGREYLELKTCQKRLEDRGITPKIKEANNNNRSLRNMMKSITPVPVKRRQAVKKAVKNQSEEGTVKPRQIQMRAQLFLGKLGRPGCKRRIWERKLRTIYITFDEKIDSIEYVGDSCVRNLLKEFNTMEGDEE